MYTPPPFQARSRREPRVRGGARLRHGLRLGRQQADRVVAAVSVSTMPTTARRGWRFMSRATIRWRTLADGASSWLMAVNGADAYVSADWYASPDQVPTWLYQAVHLTGTVRDIVRRRTRSASRRAQRQIRKLAGAEAALDVVEDDGRAARCHEEGDRGLGDVGRGGRGQLQAEPAQIRCRSCRGGRTRWRGNPMPPRSEFAQAMRALRPQAVRGTNRHHRSLQHAVEGTYVMSTKKKSAFSAPPATPAPNWCACCCGIPRSRSRC